MTDTPHVEILCNYCGDDTDHFVTREEARQLSATERQAITCHRCAGNPYEDDEAVREREEAFRMEFLEQQRAEMPAVVAAQHCPHCGRDACIDVVNEDDGHLFDTEWREELAQFIVYDVSEAELNEHEHYGRCTACDGTRDNYVADPYVA